MAPYLDTKQPNYEDQPHTLHYLMDLDNADLNIIRTGVDIIVGRMIEKDISPEERTLLHKVLRLKSILNA